MKKHTHSGWPTMETKGERETHKVKMKMFDRPTNRSVIIQLIFVTSVELDVHTSARKSPQRDAEEAEAAWALVSL